MTEPSIHKGSNGSLWRPFFFFFYSRVYVRIWQPSFDWGASLLAVIAAFLASSQPICCWRLEHAVCYNRNTHMAAKTSDTHKHECTQIHTAYIHLNTQNTNTSTNAKRNTGQHTRLQTHQKTVSIWFILYRNAVVFFCLQISQLSVHQINLSQTVVSRLLVVGIDIWLATFFVYYSQMYRIM